ncbi:MAG: hypothetical protein OXE99_04090 [Cellvibrionales bacterium]|nr:hypothetical protein [Cellvibrionales bacterium]
MAVHGFRSIASTALNELGKEADLIEAALAHGLKDDVRAAYNRADYVDRRRQLMQDWEDILVEAGLY